MIKKNMNTLFNEIVRIKRKIDGGHMKYYGEKQYGDSNGYCVLLKSGEWFMIQLGTKIIPNIHKRDVAYIMKTFSAKSTDKTGYDRARKYAFDTDSGWIPITRLAILNKTTKYKTDLQREINTEYWD